MLILLISCFSFILVSKSLWLMKKVYWGLLSVSPWFWKGLSWFMVSWFHQKGKMMLVLKKRMRVGCNVVEMNYVEKDKMLCLLDLPELTLDCILERLSPAGLCSMAGVSSYLRERCKSDHLWEKHMKQKWGKVIGDAAYREWQWHINIASSSRNNNTPKLLDPSKPKGFFRSLTTIIISPFSWFRPPNFEITRCSNKRRRSNSCGSIISWYLSLETGNFWFPAQVYNRENGHAGFMLSCYDAKLRYDSKTDTFQARYSAHGRPMTEENISWDRLRIPPVDTPSYDLHVSDSDCLLHLKPGDHIEIQWRRSKEFPYGWWYGVVGHLQSCDGNQNHCHCQYTDTVMLEFKQYPVSSRWRQTMINRKNHREVGNKADGFYGGLRKLYKEEDISMWRSLWPNHILS